jgi:hypothetical protein
LFDVVLVDHRNLASYRAATPEGVPILVEKERRRLLPSGPSTGRGFSPDEEGGTALKRAAAKLNASHKPRLAQPPVPIETAGREIQLSLDRDELLGLMQDSLESLALNLGMLVVSSLLEDEVTRL